jgi:hypothetical protein
MVPRVCICMWYNDAIRKYADYSKLINEEYCRKYGFDLLFGSRQIYQGRSLAWEKVPFVLNIMDSYDYVVWIDADAFFYKDAFSILNIFSLIPSDREFIFSADYPPGTPYDINAGVFIVKCNDYSKRIMKEWAENPKLIDENPYPDFHEQGVMRGMIMRNHLDLQNHCVVLPYGYIQHFYEYEADAIVTRGVKLNFLPPIFHLAANEREDREKKTKLYWETHFAPKG